MSQREDSFYRDVTCCNHTLHVDDMFARFSDEKRTLLFILLSTPNRTPKVLWGNESPLSIDRECMWKMGTHVPSSPSPARDRYVINHQTYPITRGLRRSHSCPQCRNMERLADFSKHPVGTPFEIEAGNETGKRYVISRTPINLSLNFQASSLHPSMQYYYKAHQEKPEYVLESDPFTNNILISTLLQYILSHAGIPNCCNLVTAFVCGDTGYTLQEIPTFTSVEELVNTPEYVDEEGDLHPEITKCILQQLFALLQVLSGFDFIHGNPTAKTSLSFKREPCSYEIDGVLIKCPVTLVLSNLEQSSLTINTTMGRVRVCPVSFLPSLHINKKLETCLNGKLTLTQPKLDVYQYLQRVGVPTDISLDAYGFLLSLMSVPSFANSVIKNDVLQSAWQHLEIPDNLLSIQEPKELMTKITLHRDVIPEMWNNLRRI